MNKSAFDVVFISHANPEDNYCAAWLASKLRLLGYDVWCDVDEFKGGEDAWKEIDQTIRGRAAKFLFVTSKTSISKRGTLKELAVADRITDRGNFIVPLRIDDVKYSDLPPEIIRLIATDFSQNWSAGLAMLVELLEKDAVPRSSIPNSMGLLDFWFKSQSISTDTLVNRPESYKSNWYELVLPSTIYLHYLPQQDPVILGAISYPYIVENGLVISFACEKCLGSGLVIRQTEAVPVLDFLKNATYTSPANQRVVKDTNKKVVRLLNWAFSNYLVSKGLTRYSLSQDDVFYFPHTVGTPYPKVDLKRYSRSSIQLAGKMKKFTWHLAINGQAFLFPLHAYFISYHVLFTRDGRLVGQALQHRLRRSIGKSWYNKKWRDLLLGAMVYISPSGSAGISIPVCCSQSVFLNDAPIEFQCSTGYREPV